MRGKSAIKSLTRKENNTPVGSIRGIVALSDMRNRAKRDDSKDELKSPRIRVEKVRKGNLTVASSVEQSANNSIVSPNSKRLFVRKNPSQLDSGRENQPRGKTTMKKHMNEAADYSFNQHKVTKTAHKATVLGDISNSVQ